MPRLSRRDLLRGVTAAVAAGSLAACDSGRAGSGPARSFGPTPSLVATPGQRTVTARLTAHPVTLDLGGPTVDTWAYGDGTPGPLIRARAGDLLRVDVTNRFLDDTTVHWHGIRLRNVADGVPGLTQDPIRPGSSLRYEFVAPDPGTYFYHPHVGVQLDRGLYGPLIIDDPADPGDYDAEWVIVLDDWIDGTGTTPDQVLADLLSGKGAGIDHGSMGGMHHGSMMGGSMMGDSAMVRAGGEDPFGEAADVAHPYFLVNGRVPAAPTVLRGAPGQRVRLRIINAAADTIFSVAVGGHRLTVTHCDGYPVVRQQVGAFAIGMGERFDVEVTLRDGVFPLVAMPYGKKGKARALLRTAGGDPPSVDVTPQELSGPILLGSDLTPAESARLPRREPDDTAMIHLSGQMEPYRWEINGAVYGENTPIPITQGARTRLQAMNMSMMTHPVHVHGHTFALPSGLRKDTVLVPAMGAIDLDFEADNPGDWMAHCHNAYHGEAGMMIALEYQD